MEVSAVATFFPPEIWRLDAPIPIFLPRPGELCLTWMLTPRQSAKKPFVNLDGGEEVRDPVGAFAGFFAGDRAAVRQAAIVTALQMLAAEARG